MIRTRFAPSPTGFLHVGGLRTALYCYLFAKQNGGKFILRIEDTDRARTVPGAVEGLLDILKWAGLEFDEGPSCEGDKGGGPHAPYIQSLRTEIYKKYADELLAKGHAYRCFCTTERLTAMRARQAEEKQAPKYDRACLKLTKKEVEDLVAQEKPFVVRQKIPSGVSVDFEDVVRGNVSFDAELVDDQVLLKSDGFPTYHLANVVDDHEMGITHVIRGEEWLSSTPKHILLYTALGWKHPQFAHLPLLLNKDKSKLSKRQGDVAVEDYREKGFLPEAVLNFIALLGWHPGGDETQEIFTLEELVQKFSLGKVHKGGAVFDLEKLNWINWQWRRRKFAEQPGDHTAKLIELCESHIPASWLSDRVFLGKCLKTVEEKVLQNPASAEENLKFYFADEVAVDPNLIALPKMKIDIETAKKSIKAVLEAFEKADDKAFETDEAIKSLLLQVISDLKLKNGQVLWPIRVTITGEQFSPGVFEIIWALGKEKMLERLKNALKKN